MNNKKWNRVLTGAATVALAVGTLAPMAFAATGSSGVQYNTRTISVGSGYTAVIQGVVASDNGTMTEFLPIYYLNQGLGKLGYTVSWNGNTRTLSITTPAGVTVQAPTTAVGAPGANQMVIEVNGTAVQLAPRQVAKDPATGVYTTYAPIYYLNNALSLAGFTNTYNSQGWTVQGPAASQSTTAGLSNITVKNASNGTGTQADPAVSLTDAAITMSVTLEDANGNPIPNTAITFNVSNYGSISNINLPNVANASGAFIASQKGTNAYEYTAYTDANGVATISMTGPAGSTNLYEVQATAPYAGANNSAMSSQPAYAEFVAGNTVGLSPYGSYNAALGSQVPVTVTLPPNSAGQPQSGVLIQLNNGSGGGYFTNAAGADLGGTVSVVTNSSGIAQTFFTDSTQESDTVSVTQTSLPSGLTAPTDVTINFAQSGIPAKIQNFSMTATSVQSGQNVTVYGTLVDSAGNPVPNGQILVVGNSTAQGGVTPSNDNNAHLNYVTGAGSSATTTSFPNAGAVVTNLNSGTPGSTTGISLNNGATASSSVGEVVTADSAGNFNFVLTDSHDNETGYFSIYAVSNGQVVNSTTATSSSTPAGEPLYSDSVNFNAGTTISSISIGGTDFQAYNNTYTAATGFAGTEGSSTEAKIFVDPQNAAGNPLPPQSFIYNVSIDNGGAVTSVGAATTHYTGTNLTNGAIQLNPANPGVSALTINETYTSTGTNQGFYTVTVPGQSGSITINAGSNSVFTDNLNPDLILGVENQNNTGNTTLTITSGSAKSTAVIAYGSGSAAWVPSISPGNFGVTSGQYSTLTYQVQDDQGNPVPNSMMTIATDKTGASSDPFFITNVNGVTLAQTEVMGTNLSSSEPTPIPLSGLTTNLGYNTVTIPGVATWNGTGDLNTNPNEISVYTDSSGNVTLTLQASGTAYYAGTSGIVSSSGPWKVNSTSPGANVTESVYSFGKKGDNTSGYDQLFIGQSSNDFTTSSGGSYPDLQPYGTLQGN